MFIEGQVRVNPIVMMFFNLLVPLTMMFGTNLLLRVSLLLFISTILFLHRKFRRWILGLIAYLFFFCIERFTLGTENVFLESFGSIFVAFKGFLPCIMASIVLIFDYKPTQILSSLEKLHLPKIFIIALTITTRYIPIFHNEKKLIKQSLRLRGIAPSWTQPVEKFEYLIIPQLFRCLSLAEEVTAAGLVKGINSTKPRSSFYQQELSVLDWMLLVILVALIGGSLYAG